MVANRLCSRALDDLVSRRGISWCPPCHGVLKFNVNGFAMVLHSSRHPWKFWGWFRKIDEVILKLLAVCFHNRLHETNSMVDGLARGG
ncbi:hypothetical protein GQ457_17G015170 [Hibiscus cannabinus]